MSQHTHIYLHPVPFIVSSHYLNCTSTQSPPPQCYTSPFHHLTFPPLPTYNSSPAAVSLLSILPLTSFICNLVIIFMLPVRPTQLHHQSLMPCNSIICIQSLLSHCRCYTTTITNHHITNHSPSSPSPVTVMPTQLCPQSLPLQLFYFYSNTMVNHFVFILLPRLAPLFLFHYCGYTTNHSPPPSLLTHIIMCHQPA